MNLRISSWRLVNLIAFLFCVGLLISAAYMQLVLGMKPCPLCIIQRVVILVLSFLFAAGTLYVPLATGRKILGGLTFLTAATGVGIAIRHVWVVYNPLPGIQSCGADLSVYMNNLPMLQTIKLLFQGTGDCSKDAGHFLGLYLPEWMLIFFLFFALIGLWEIFKKN